MYIYISVYDKGVLTIRRNDSKLLALPGGFIDAKDLSWRHAAARYFDAMFLRDLIHT